MSERRLRYFDWRQERVDIVGSVEYSILIHPDLRNKEVPIKAYQSVDHGQTPQEFNLRVSSNSLRSSLNEFRKRVFEEQHWTSWSTGVGGVFFDSGEQRCFLPMLDLETTSTNDLQGDMNVLVGGLKQLEIDGGVFRSGDVGVGSYYFVGYDPQRYFPNYWRFMGKALTAFAHGVSDNAVMARDFGKRLMNISRQGDLEIIAEQMLANFPSIRTGQTREGLLVDPRWIAHKLKDGFTVLRYVPGKNYEDRPLQVAGFY